MSGKSTCVNLKNLFKEKKKLTHKNRIISSKYNYITFIPLNILYQLSKPSTFFFFCTLCLLYIKALSPFSPFDYTFAFSIVLSTSMIKDALEDYQRHIEDNGLNLNKVSIINTSAFINRVDEDTTEDTTIVEEDAISRVEDVVSVINVEDISMGDLVYFRKEDLVCADVILLKAFERNKVENKYNCINHSFIETSNLDGETNLKKKSTVVESKTHFLNSENDVVTHRNIDKHLCECINNYIQGLDSFVINDTGDSFTDFDCTIKYSKKFIKSIEDERSIVRDNRDIKNDAKGDIKNDAKGDVKGDIKNDVEDKDDSINKDGDNGDVEDDIKNDVEDKDDSINKDGDNGLVDVMAASKNIILRGSKIMNTTCALCLVVAVGKDTKQSKSIQTGVKSISSFEKEINHTLLIIFILYVFMLASTATFAYFNSIIPMSAFDVLKNICSNSILYTYLIPLSLFLMIEIAKILHAHYISIDEGMFRRIEVNETERLEESVRVMSGTGNNSRVGITNRNLNNLTEGNTSTNLTDGNYLNSSTNLTDGNSSNGNISLNGNISSSGNIPSSSNISSSSNNSSSGNISSSSNNSSSGNVVDDGKMLVGSRCRNTHVIEDLGCIDYILTDKTGTITENTMTIKYIHTTKGNQQKVDNWLKLIDCKNFHKNLDDFNNLLVLNMLICNSIEVLDEKYEGMSQEEISVLEKLKNINLFLKDRTQNSIKFEFSGTNFEVQILDSLEFTSKRQRQSVLCSINGNIFLFSKGADQKLLSRNNHIDNETLKFISAVCEYRTLVFKFKKLSNLELNEFLNKKKILTENITDAHKIESIEEDLYSELESDTTYLGSTLIEDKLGENIHSTLTILKKSGIKLWMITGDKKETAVSCALNSGLATPGNFLVMEGKQITMRLENKQELDEIFWFGAIIVYRATPSQKGKIAQAVRSLGKRTLAVGDGNNDVAMLKLSNVGVGIKGKEGRQAVLNADFAIPTFSCLRRLILYHGRFNLIRYSKIVTNSFYKNLYFILVQYFFNFYNGGSGVPVYESTFMNYYNLIYTSMIPMTIGLFERDEEIFKRTDSIYWESRNQKRASQEYDFKKVITYKNARAYFDRRVVRTYLIGGMFQSLIMFLFYRYMIVGGISDSTGKLLQGPGEGLILTIIIFLAVINAQFRFITFINKYSWGSLALSIFLAVFFTFGLHGINFFKMNIFESEIIPKLFKAPFTYFTICVGLIGAYTMETLFKIYVDNLLNTIFKENSQ